MAIISTANLTTLADSVAKALVDLESAYISNPTSNAPTVATVTMGVGTTQKGRVASLNDVQQEAALAQPTITDVANVLAYMSLSAPTFYAQYRDLMNALDTHVGGLNAFLVTNTLQVHPEFANCFNNWATNAVALGQRGVAPTSIAATQIFPSAAQTLASVAVTGAATGTFAAGTALNTANVAAQQLYLKNNTLLAAPAAAPVPTAATATVANASALGAGVYTVGYTFTTAAGETTISPTATVTLTVGQQINVASIALPSGATSIKFYISIAAGNATVGFSGVSLTAAAATTIANLGAASLAAPASNTAGIATSGTATSFTVSYTNAAGVSGQTATQALSGALAAGATLAIGVVVGSAVSNIVVNSGGVNGDQIAVVVNPLRTVAY